MADAVLSSLAESEIRDLEVIDKAANGWPDKLAIDENGCLILDSKGFPIVEEYGLPPNWKASAWRLERKFPERWGRKVKMIEETDSSNNQIVVTFVDP